MKLYRIKKSKIDKNGLYANQDKKGTRIIEYKGKVITRNKPKKIQNLITVKQSIFLIE